MLCNLDVPTATSNHVLALLNYLSPCKTRNLGNGIHSLCINTELDPAFNMELLGNFPYQVTSAQERWHMLLAMQPHWQP
jgi:hypothetical protein